MVQESTSGTKWSHGRAEPTRRKYL